MCMRTFLPGKRLAEFFRTAMARSHASRTHKIARLTRVMAAEISLRCAMGAAAAKVLRDLQWDTL